MPEEPIFGWNSSGGRNLHRRKLLAGEKVEVRSVEEGFLGSWYSATVLSSKKRRLRSIRYNHILSDDATDYLVETVDVSEVVEGLSSSSGSLRGSLRPVPPKLEVDRFSLVYGLCVDVLINEAWWEGVIFDHENGSQKRSVFFPDLGDETDADLQSLRVTQDWDEVTEAWECRGRWMFLQLIEKYEEDNYLPVSVKQLWYDIRVRVGFARIREWTCSIRHLWEDLMVELKKLLKTYACPSGVEVEVIAPQEQQFFSNDKDHRCMSMPGLASLSGIRSEESYINGVTELSSQKSTSDHIKLILPDKLRTWQFFYCVVKSCPQAVSSYIRAPLQIVAFHVRKHLKYMGWTIEQTVDEGGRHRFRYLSPDGRLNEKSLRQICIILKQRDQPLAPPVVAKPLSLPSENWKCNTREMRSIVLALPACNRNVALGDGRKSPAATLLECGSQGKEEVFNRKSGESYPSNAAQNRKRALYFRLETKTKAQGFERLRSKRKQKPNLRYRSRENKLTVGSRDVNLSRTRGQTSRVLTDIKNRVTGRGKPRVSRSSKRLQRDVPDGDWFCASCCCEACGLFIAKNTSKYAKDNILISCKQCERKYHPSCLQDSLNTFLAEKWFCSKDCEEIFVNLRELIGKPREVCLKKKLTWRLVQSLEQDTFGTDASKIEAVAETHCKLSVALDVMHELFEPVKRRHSGGDLAEDVIFSRWSKYKRLNFSGFYTVLLERNDELITVATVRILGKKVAEMPFIGTRFQHRQHGMCRVLIDLGVERLVLPAVRCVLDTWINSFGFSKVIIPEKKNFLQFTFLEFGRTILCQKILIMSSVSHPPPSTSTEQNMRIEDISASDDRSEVHQAEKHLEESSSTKNTPEYVVQNLPSFH
ncbi:unnamed protein product [Brassica oleracea var. botrytis]|uniref:Agenet domain-containing protein n=1 Tax=Brassica oleracea TaxID=3712 RepID=A0A3P6EF00_BRAOL|nr:unnamed protein product [Brassica oleracea]